MKQLLQVFLIFSVLVLLSGCTIGVGSNNETESVERIEAEAYSFDRAYIVDSFSLDQLLIKVHLETYWHYVSVNQNMLSVTDQNKLEEAGTHTLTIHYQGKQTEASVTLVESSQALLFHHLFTLGFEDVEQDFFTWFDGLVLEKTVAIESIELTEDNVLFVTLSNDEVIHVGQINLGRAVVDVMYEAGRLIVEYEDEEVVEYTVDQTAAYRVTFLTESGKFIDVRSAQGSTVTQPNPPTKEGYTFTSWSEDLSAITSDTLVYALYEATTQTLSFDTRGGQTISSVSVATGDTFTVPVPVRTNYTFLGWFTNSDLTLALSSALMPAHDVTLYAAWQPQVSEDAYDSLAMLEDALKPIVGITNQKTDSTTGSGTGIIYKQEGSTYYVLTNEHVIRDYDSLSISYERYGVLYQVSGAVSVVGVDETSDVALLTFDSSQSFETAVFGDSSQLRKGETVYALGHPRGFAYFNSVTKGIVSNLQREVNHENLDVLLIQTDAAINPGNSGGALINRHGEVIGMNTLKLTGDDIDNQGYAVPSNTFLKVLNDLENFGANVPVRLGVSVNQNPATCNASYGVCVEEVFSDTTASQLALEVGDAIVGFKTESMDSYQTIYNFLDLRDRLLSTNVDTLISLEILRNEAHVTTDYYAIKARD